MKMGKTAVRGLLLLACLGVLLPAAAAQYRASIQGVVTDAQGSVVSGAAKVGDEVEWHKGDGTTELVRVRGLNNHGKPAVER